MDSYESGVTVCDESGGVTDSYESGVTVMDSSESGVTVCETVMRVV